MRCEKRTRCERTICEKRTRREDTMAERDKKRRNETYQPMRVDIVPKDKGNPGLDLIPKTQ